MNFGSKFTAFSVVSHCFLFPKGNKGVKWELKLAISARDRFILDMVSRLFETTVKSVLRLPTSWTRFSTSADRSARTISIWSVILVRCAGQRRSEGPMERIFAWYGFSVAVYFIGLDFRVWEDSQPSCEVQPRLDGCYAEGDEACVWDSDYSWEAFLSEEVCSFGCV